MDHNQETAKSWNKVANLYESKFMDLDIYDQTYDFFCDQFADANVRILELGCGPGNITRYILNKYRNFSIHGVDYAPNMIELARQNVPTATFQVLDCRTIKSIDQIFDGILIGFCIPYLSNQECSKLFEDCNAMLTAGGSIYISFMDGDESRSGPVTGSSGDKMYFHYHQTGHISKKLQNLGFHISKVFEVTYQRTDETSEMHTIICAKKTES